MRDKAFVWRIEVPLLVLLVVVVIATGRILYKNDQQARRAVEVRRAAVSAATAAERVAHSHEGSYLGLNGKTESALRDAGYEGPAAVTIRISSTKSNYCLVAEDLQVGGTWRDTTFDSRSHAVAPGDRCP